MKGKITLDDIFIEVYKAFPSSIMGREDIDFSNNIILPPSALKKLSSMKNFGDSRNPILFRILNIDLNIMTHCGVAEFTSEEDICYLPTNIFERLCLMEGQTINLRNVELRPGYFIKIQPHLTEFGNNLNLAISGVSGEILKNYFCVTEGDTISIKIGNKIYNLDIIECKPARAIRTLNSDIEIDYAPPKDSKNKTKNDSNQ